MRLGQADPASPSSEKARYVVCEIEALYQISRKRRLTNSETVELGRLSDQLYGRAEWEIVNAPVAEFGYARLGPGRWP